MNLSACGRVLNHPRKIEELQEQRPLLGGVDAGRHLFYVFRIKPSPPKDARYAGVSILHVIDRVLIRLLNGYGEVEVHLGSVREAHVEVACHILPHLVHKLVERYEISGTLADLDLLPSTHELY